MSFGSIEDIASPSKLLSTLEPPMLPKEDLKEIVDYLKVQSEYIKSLLYLLTPETIQAILPTGLSQKGSNSTYLFTPVCAIGTYTGEIAPEDKVEVFATDKTKIIYLVVSMLETITPVNDDIFGALSAGGEEAWQYSSGMKNEFISWYTNQFTPKNDMNQVDQLYYYIAFGRYVP